MDHGLEWSCGATSLDQLGPNHRLGEPHRSGYEQRVGEVDCQPGQQRSRFPPGEQPEQFEGRPREERSSPRRGTWQAVTSQARPPTWGAGQGLDRPGPRHQLRGPQLGESQREGLPSVAAGRTGQSHAARREGNCNWRAATRQAELPSCADPCHTRVATTGGRGRTRPGRA